MADESATGILRAEHQCILRVVDALERTLNSLETGGPPDIDVLSDSIAFFRLFVDACHHGKEEKFLFTELETAGMPGDRGPVAVMLEEHRRGRDLVRRMATSLHAARSSRYALHELQIAAWAYIDLIRSHIGKEDGVLFEVADGLIAGPGCQRLCAAYRDADERSFESRSKAELETLADRLAERTA